nr:MAG TPA: hypothetical protein [Caudoviricetes sp.]
MTMKTAIDTAYELATKYAQCIWWTRIPILSRHDPRLGANKTAPAAWCEVCEEVYAELPNNKSPYIAAAEAAPAHIKDAHPAYWDAFIDQAYLAIRAAVLWWAGRRNLPETTALHLVENPLAKHWMNIHLPCPTGCGTTLHEHFATDQIKDEANLAFSQDVTDACILRMAEHLMRHSSDKLRAL